jgi:hypothetical protein
VVLFRYSAKIGAVKAIELHSFQTGFTSTHETQETRFGVYSWTGGYVTFKLYIIHCL